MRFIRGLENFPGGFPNLVVTVGNFDGVHLGHQRVLQEAVKKASRVQGVSLVFIFEPHPLKFLKPQESVPFLTTLAQKLRLIQDMGIDLVLCANFDTDMLRLSPRQFVQEVLLEKLEMREIVEGSDFSFGNGRVGTAETLRRLGQELGFGVTVSEPVRVEREIVHSSLIRKQVLLGRVEQATKLLGRPYTIEGKVVEGNKRGKKLGFPTVNLASENPLPPRVGVYATFVEHRSQFHRGVTNVGYRPTFGEGGLTVETFILDFRQDIYGEEISLLFVRWLRDEMKFSSVDALIRQMEQDVEEAGRALGERNGLPTRTR